MKKLVLSVLFALLPAGGALAQSYSFEVPKAVVTVRVGRDGSALIHYAITFHCMPGAHAVDVVDIGMPHMGGGHQPVGAAIDGRPISAGQIRTSTFLKPRGCGYEVHLGANAIRPGNTGVFEFTGRERNMVWQDTTNPEQASFRFGTTWFGPQFCHGVTNLVVRYVLPVPADDYPTVKERILWHRKGEEFSAKGVHVGEEYASVAWARKVPFTRQHTFSVSFPKKYVSSVRKDSLWAIFYRWFKASPKVRAVFGLVLVILWSIIFFTATRGTGWSLWLILTIAMIVGMAVSPAFQLWTLPLVALLGGLLIFFRRRGREHYFPAELCREGGGIKRGLTAVEAAVLLEVPLNKILTMLIFGLARKGVVRIREAQPLALDVVAEEKSPGVWMLPGDAPAKVWPYEPGFITAFREQAFKPVHEMDLKAPFDQLIKQVVGSMGGFSLTETRNYYQYVVSRAWKQVKSEADYEARFKQADRNISWLMLDDDWSGGMRGLEGGGYYYRPWWYYGRPYGSYSWSRGSMAGPIGGGAASAPEFSAPSTSFGDVANSLTGRLENVSNSLAGSLDSLGSTAKGGIDLSNFDNFTTDMLSEMLENSGGGGGGGFGGCACAGCACACACAGGGR